MTMLAVLGPGLIVMAADNDAGTVSVFAQAGQRDGVRLLWALLLLAPVLFVSQEMAARLGAVTGIGHARLIRERFGRLWCGFSLGDLLLLNFAILVTEFIGVALSLSYFGVSRYVAVPLAASALIAVTAGGSFRRWERAMYLLVIADLSVILLAVVHHPQPMAVAGGLIPGLDHGAASSTLLLLMALVGTSLAPWQIFFQQSNVIDKRITPRWLALRADRHRRRRPRVRRRRRGRDDHVRRRVQPWRGARAICRRRRDRPRAERTSGPRGGRAVRRRAAQRVPARRRGDLTRERVRDQRGPRREAFAAPRLPRCRHLPPLLRRPHPRRRRHCADPARATGRHHHPRAGARRNPAAEHARAAADAVQRREAPRTTDESSLAQRHRRDRRRRDPRALDDADGHHRPPPRQRRARARGDARTARRRCPDARRAAHPSGRAPGDRAADALATPDVDDADARARRPARESHARASSASRCCAPTPC